MPLQTVLFYSDFTECGKPYFRIIFRIAGNIARSACYGAQDELKLG